MTAYGRRRCQEIEYREWGPPSRQRKMLSKTRKKTRRLLHKQARRDAKATLSSLAD